ncbi:hypothetical protein BD413DRAFT_2415 [Trametes elegans]|nr:hypothetical protein BD413DRAFT_2415 [Trametes elegans]
MRGGWALRRLEKAWTGVNYVHAHSRELALGTTVVGTDRVMPEPRPKRVERTARNASGTAEKVSGRARNNSLSSPREAQLLARSTGPIRWETCMRADRQVNEPFHGPLSQRMRSRARFRIYRGLNRLHVSPFRHAWLAVGGSSQRLSDVAGGSLERVRRRKASSRPSHGYLGRPALETERGGPDVGHDEQGPLQLACWMLYKPVRVLPRPRYKATEFHATVRP